jgi:two-component system sensor histidine kinase and response regulator WspE
MLDLFRQELEAQSEELAAGLLRLEQTPSDTRHVAAMMRAAHSIKGAARIAGFADAVRLAHDLEDCFEDLAQGRLELAATDYDELLSSVDLLRRYKEPSSPDDSEVVGSLARDVEAMLRRIAELRRSAGSPRAPETSRGSPTPSPSVTSSPMVAQFRDATGDAQRVLTAFVRDAGGGTPRTSALDDAHEAAARVASVARLAGLRTAGRLASLATAALEIMRSRGAPESADLEALAGAVRLLGAGAGGGADLGEELSAEVEERVAEWERLVRGDEAVGPTGTDHSPSLPAAEAAQRPFPPRPSGEQAAPARSAAPTSRASRERPPEGGEIDAPPEVPTPGSGLVVVRGKSGTTPSIASKPDSVAQPSRFVRITTENLDRLMGLAGESLVQANWLQPFADSLLALKSAQYSLSLQLERLREVFGEAGDDGRASELLRGAFAELQSGQELMNDRIAEMEHYARRSVSLSDRLYHEVVQSRMRPIADGIRGFPRLVRDVARSLGKSAHLEIEGEDTEVDRDILEKLEAPLNHLLRNSVDHGLESPEERTAQGKPPQGRVVLRAAHRAGMLWIRLADDGRGIDVDRIRERIVDRSILTAEAAATLSDGDLIDYLFTPGFSTAKSVSEISGRGVGLDVVRSTVGSLGGSVHATSEAGRGTMFELELPLTLSVVRALLVEVSGEPFAVPVTRLEQILRLEESDVFTVQGRRCCSWNGHNIGLVPAALVLDLEATGTDDEATNVIVLRDRKGRMGLCVDRLLGEHDLVVRPITKRLGKIPDISAAAVLPDGQIVLIIDVDDVLRNIARLNVSGRLTGAPHRARGVQLLRHRVLVADDSESVRELECRLLESRGYETHPAVDGEDAMAHLAASHFDLLITDADMPKLDGFELIQKVRATPAFDGLPIVMVSYNETQDYSRRALEAGADRYVTKSQITTGAWLETIEKLLEDAGGAGRNPG